MDSRAILHQIHSLVLDCSQVVSYKWLSRNFSISSNAAKRLLERFVDSYDDKIEAVYAVAGWVKAEPKCYSVRLSKKAKLEEAKADLDDSSICIYSVQSSIPKDPSILWNAEFVQAEELFNKLSVSENCLRDNRFSAVSYASIGCEPNGNISGVSSATEKQQTGSSSTMLKHVKTVPVTKPSVNHSAVAKGVSSEKTANPLDSNKISTGPDNNKKQQNGKSTGGSLANLWNNASTKQTSRSLQTPAPNVKKDGIAADAQTSDLEAAVAVSSDDEEVFRRSIRSNSRSGKTRRVFSVESDDENENDEGGVIRLESPEAPKQTSSINLNNEKQKNKCLPNESPAFSSRKETDKCKPMFGKTSTKPANPGSVDQGKFKSASGEGMALSDKSKGDLPKEKPCINTRKVSGTSTDVNVDMNTFKKGKETHDGQGDISLAEKRPYDNAAASNGAPKKRRVLKRYINEKGREVTEVTWETDVESEKATAHSHTTENSASIGQISNKSSSNPKMQSTDQSHTTNATAKVGAKHTQKGKAKDSRQGNILSFFKKQ